MGLKPSVQYYYEPFPEEPPPELVQCGICGRRFRKEALVSMDWSFFLSIVVRADILVQQIAVCYLQASFPAKLPISTVLERYYWSRTM